jgi:hypothetical protein
MFAVAAVSYTAAMMAIAFSTSLKRPASFQTERSNTYQGGQVIPEHLLTQGATMGSASEHALSVELEAVSLMAIAFNTGGECPTEEVSLNLCQLVGMNMHCLSNAVVLLDPAWWISQGKK